MTIFISPLCSSLEPIFELLWFVFELTCLYIFRSGTDLISLLILFFFLSLFFLLRRPL